jgi:integrase
LIEKRRITKRVVDALKEGEKVWDSDLPGFCVRRQKKSKSYIVKYRNRPDGKQRLLTIGRHGQPDFDGNIWTPDRARSRAAMVVGQAKDPTKPDPIVELKAANQAPNMAELCDRFLVEHAEEHKKASSVKADRANIKNHVKPLLGHMLISSVTLADIDRFKRSVRSGKTAAKGKKHGFRGGAVVSGGAGVANRCLSLLSKMFNTAERWGWRAQNSNPCRGVEKYPENKKDRFLSIAELVQLGKTLETAEQNGSETPYSIAAIRLLLFTGARLNEILSLQWNNVDFERCVLALPDSKTGAKVIYLSAPALEVLSNLPKQEGNPHVICGHKKGAHLVNITKPWYRMRSAAGLEGVRIHDLRHSFASVGATGGLSLQMIGNLLGHSRITTTERYAHLSDDPLRTANDTIGQRISAAMKNEVSEIISLRTGKQETPE